MAHNRLIHVTAGDYIIVADGHGFQAVTSGAWDRVRGIPVGGCRVTRLSDEETGELDARKHNDDRIRIHDFRARGGV